MTYNGYKNYETWNVALWITNDYELYSAVIEMKPKFYKKFIEELEFENEKTPDGVRFISNKLSYRELNRVIRDIIQEV